MVQFPARKMAGADGSCSIEGIDIIFSYTIPSAFDSASRA